MGLTEPTLDYVQQRLCELEGDERFYGAERAVGLVFAQWPHNREFEHVLVKTIVLNRLYSTSIYDVWTVAKHILDLGIDERLRQGDVSLVHDMASVSFKEKPRFVLSFATKYCSWHEPERFQIFDSNVKWLLWEYQRQFRFGVFRKYELRQYPRFVQIVDELRSRFELTGIGRKKLDKFLWIEGRQRSRAGGTAAREGTS
ncbi:MAG: hypothetical protein HYS13_11885 [Planctomycetia bacterium]|nr:hypothetical protein [Planctomycetia bacterium]